MNLRRTLRRIAGHDPYPERRWILGAIGVLAVAAFELPKPEIREWASIDWSATIGTSGSVSIITLSPTYTITAGNSVYACYTTPDATVWTTTPYTVTGASVGTGMPQ